MDDAKPIRPNLDDAFLDDAIEEDDGCDELYADCAPPMPTLEELRESLAQSDADVAAGRVFEGEVVLAELRQMIEDYEAERAVHGASRA